MIWLPSPRHPSCDFIWGWTTIYATCPNSLFHIPTYDLDSVRVCPTRLKKSTFVAPTPTKITETLEWALMNRRPWMHHACDRTRPIHTAPMMRIKLQRIHRPHPKFRNDKCYPSTQYVGWWQITILRLYLHPQTLLTRTAWYHKESPIYVITSRERIIYLFYTLTSYTFCILSNPILIYLECKTISCVIHPKLISGWHNSQSIARVLELPKVGFLYTHTKSQDHENPRALEYHPNV